MNLKNKFWAESCSAQILCILFYSAASFAGNTEIEVSGSAGKMDQAPNPNNQSISAIQKFNETTRVWISADRQSRFGLNDSQVGVGYAKSEKMDGGYFLEATTSPSADFLPRISFAVGLNRPDWVQDADLSLSAKYSKYFNANVISFPLGGDYYFQNGFVLTAKIFPGLVKFNEKNSSQFVAGGFLRALLDKGTFVRPSAWFGFSSEPQFAAVLENSSRIQVSTVGAGLRLNWDVLWVEPQIEYQNRQFSFYSYQWMANLILHFYL